MSLTKAYKVGKIEYKIKACEEFLQDYYMASNYYLYLKYKIKYPGKLFYKTYTCSISGVDHPDYNEMEHNKIDDEKILNFLNDYMSDKEGMKDIINRQIQKSVDKYYNSLSKQQRIDAILKANKKKIRLK